MAGIGHFHQGNAGRSMIARYDCGVRSGRERCCDSSFKIVWRRQACAFDRDLLAIPPIVVAAQQCAVAVVQLQDWIRQSVGYLRLREGGPIARTTTRAPFPAPAMKPPIITLSPVPTRPRVLMFARREVLAVSRS